LFFEQTGNCELLSDGDVAELALRSEAVGLEVIRSRCHLCQFFLAL
jgi:hypothetical protein